MKTKADILAKFQADKKKITDKYQRAVTHAKEQRDTELSRAEARRDQDLEKLGT